MRTSHLLQRRAVVIWAIGLILGVGGGTSLAAKTSKKDKTEATASGKGSVPPGVALNACGCYQTGNSCVCTNKNAKCECAGECEPVGCEAKRQKEMDREVAVEVKRAEDDQKKREAAEAESERKAAEAEAAREKAEEGGDDDTAAAGDEKAAEPAADKPGEKAGNKAADKPGDKAADKPTSKPVHKGRAAKKPARTPG